VLVIIKRKEIVEKIEPLKRV